MILVGANELSTIQLVSAVLSTNLPSQATLVVGNLNDENEFIPYYSNDAAFTMS